MSWRFSDDQLVEVGAWRRSRLSDDRAHASAARRAAPGRRRRSCRAHCARRPRSSAVALRRSSISALRSRAASRAGCALALVDIAERMPRPRSDVVVVQQRLDALQPPRWRPPTSSGRLASSTSKLRARGADDRVAARSARLGVRRACSRGLPSRSMNSRPVTPCSDSSATRLLGDTGVRESMSTMHLHAAGVARIDAHARPRARHHAEVAHRRAARQAADAAVEVDLVAGVVAMLARCRSTSRRTAPPWRRPAARRRRRPRSLLHAPCRLSGRACPRPLAVEVRLDPRVRDGRRCAPGCRFHPPVHDHPDTIAGTEDACPDRA